MTPLRITIVVDNCVAARTTRGEHGLCLHLALGARRLLFDTGQGLVLTDNVQALAIDLGAIDTIVLSHGHYDHTGGLPLVVAAARTPVAVHLHPDALQPKYHVGKSSTRSIGMPEAAREALARPACRQVLAREPSEIAPGLYCTGEIPRSDSPGGPTEIFHLDPQGNAVDPLLDDQSLFFDTPEGVVVVLGCAHAGVLAILDHVRHLTHDRPIHAVLGGMHLDHASPPQLQRVIEQLHHTSPRLIVPMHCTGSRAMAALWTAFPEACQAGGAGAVFDFNVNQGSLI
jgi:7,8-dihydropterin-6-yl-methyl-4-(beta-D-ribofuranosyl)aminobenzene 5'-phosphate synthase